MKHYNATITVTYRLLDIEAENEAEAEDFAYYNFHDAYSQDVEQVLLYEIDDSEEDEDDN